MRRTLLGSSLIVAMMLVMLVGAASAVAGPVWRVDSLSDTTAAPGATFEYLVQFTNVGDADMDGSEIDVTGSLPPGITAVDGRLILDSDQEEANFVKCTAGDGVSPLAGASDVRCVNSVPLTGGGGFWQLLRLTVRVDPTASGSLKTTFGVSGGGAAPVTTVDPIGITSAAPEFGIDAFDGQLTDAAGNPATQAGGHPAAATVSFGFNTYTNPLPIGGAAWPVEPVKDTLVDLPPGLVGDPTAVDQCTLAQLAFRNGIGGRTMCPSTAQAGTILLRMNNRPLTPTAVGPAPVFNMVPPPDVPARFGFIVAGTPIVLDAQLRSGGDYGLSVNGRNVSEALPVAGATFTFWGVPSDPSHDAERACPGFDAPAAGGPACATNTPRRPFLRNPTMCSDAGLPTTMRIDSWTNPGVFQSFTFRSHLPPGFPEPPSAQGPEQGPTGCDRVPFAPTLEGQPGQSTPNTPSAFAFDLTLPQPDDPDGIGESDVRTAVVTLPAGVRVNPAAADGLQACSPAQIHLHDEETPVCPDAAKIGSLTVTTPLLRDPIQGRIYLATPHENPFGTLLSIYLVAEGSGVTIKLAGRVEADPVTGRLTTTFDNNPQTPFSNLHLAFDGGPRAQLVTPRACGRYTTTAILTGWNGRVVESDPSFTISGDGHGGPCPSPRFSPGFTAGTQNPIAGGFSQFGLRLTRTDDDGEFSALSSLSLPKGLLANVSSIATRCTIEQADAHACPADSHIGEVTTGAGAGPDPFYVGGDVYLTGPYKGNPFGIAVIVHAQAGPFDLGYVVVKGAIQIHDDGSVTVATDPFPTILQGIPLQIRDIRVNLDRPGFTFNPTSCNPMSINGTVVSTANQQVGVSSRFQVGECANLAFKPSFAVSTAGRTSKANGASLHVHLGTHEGPSSAGAHGESNIAKVDVQLPGSLPARLTTLQKACTEAQFVSNPAGCPAASFVGSAIAHTPILASPLSGPAILVSHGGQAFPDLVLVLQGEGVRLNITGHTQIKKGITFSRFETVPDAPVASFDLTLPQGPHSALTTDVPGRNLCTNTKTVTVRKRITRRVHGHNRKVTVKAKKAVAASLLMPTTIVAQNGAVIHQTTKIAVTGCAKTKAVKHKPKRKGAKKRGG
jgi:hypothetical protein